MRSLHWQSLGALSASLALVSATQPPPPSAERFDLDPAHSEVGFSIRFMGLTNIRGRFNDFGGTIMYVEGDLTRSTVSVVIQTRSIDTGVQLRDNDLRGAAFFGVDSFPTITFRSARVEKFGDGLLVRGPFTMHGITKEIVIPVTVLHGKMQDAWGNTRVGFVGAVTLNRKDFGIVGANFWNSVVDLSRMALADSVRIELTVEAEVINWDRISFAARPNTRSLGEALWHTLTASDGGLQAALAQYAVLTRDSAAAFSMGEAQLNTLGYKLMRARRYPEAIAVLKLNAEAFPQSANVWDSLGEAYYLSGDTANARRSYERTLAMQPNNPGAWEVLRWLGAH